MLEKQVFESSFIIPYRNFYLKLLKGLGNAAAPNYCRSYVMHLLLFHFTYSERSLGPRVHGNGSLWNRTRTVRIGLAFTRELMEPFHTEPLAVPELVHLESGSSTEPNQKVLV